MAEENKPADAADLSKLQSTVNTLAQTVGTLVTSQSDLSKNVGIIASTLAQQAAAPAADPKAGDKKDQPVTLEAVAQLLDSKLNAANQQQQSKAARDTFVGDKLKDLPAVYRNQLGNDPAKWAGEEQSIREQYKADMKAAGVPEKKLGGTQTEGGETAANQPIDISKMTPMQKLELATKSQMPVKPAATAAAAMVTAPVAQASNPAA